LAYLLRLTDALQDWERPSAKEPNGHSAEDYSYEFIGHKLIYRVKKGRENSIKEAIKPLDGLELEII
jgi:hypothetical protein